jgi:hypothetical protein
MHEKCACCLIGYYCCVVGFKGMLHFFLRMTDLIVVHLPSSIEMKEDLETIACYVVLVELVMRI